jgi:hypothetical protein
VEHNYRQLESLNPEEFKKKITIIATMLRKSIITTIEKVCFQLIEPQLITTQTPLLLLTALA